MQEVTYYIICKQEQPNLPLRQICGFEIWTQLPIYCRYKFKFCIAVNYQQYCNSSIYCWFLTSLCYVTNFHLLFDCLRTMLLCFEMYAGYYCWAVNAVEGNLSETRSLFCLTQYSKRGWLFSCWFPDQCILEYRLNVCQGKSIKDKQKPSNKSGVSIFKSNKNQQKY